MNNLTAYKSLPSKVKCLRQVEVWQKDSTLILEGMMYKSLSGCIFGLSIERVKVALASGAMIEIPLSHPNKL